ncbi:MAG: peptide deformylase [Microthrixaceae bacterium]
MSAPHAIRIVGDPVLRQRAEEVTDIDERLVRLVDDMFTTMYDAPGVGLAAPQVGVQKRFFIYDLDHGDGQQVLINPVVEESDGEWEFTEGCLSIPGLHFDIVRPRRIHVTGVDLEGREVSLEADDYLARVIQHELDHLDGVLMLERLDEDQRKAARRAVRQLQLAASEPEPPVRGRFSFGRS